MNIGKWCSHHLWAWHAPEAVYASLQPELIKRTFVLGQTTETIEIGCLEREDKRLIGRESWHVGTF